MMTRLRVSCGCRRSGTGVPPVRSHQDSSSFTSSESNPEHFEDEGEKEDEEEQEHTGKMPVPLPDISLG